MERCEQSRMFGNGFLFDMAVMSTSDMHACTFYIGVFDFSEYDQFKS